MLLLTGLLHGQPVTYFYGGDLQPSEGEYADWFTTVGPGHPTNYRFAHTTWSSDGDVLTMNTSYSPSEGIWFGRTSGYSDPSNFSLAGTADGNLVRARVALGESSGEWSLYWYDGDGYASSFYFLPGGVNFSYRDANDEGVTEFYAIADMTEFHTFTSYILAGQVSYFVDGVYLGGGPTGVGSANFLLIGDGSATNVSGYGSFHVDSLEIITAVGASAPSLAAVPEPATTALGMAALAGGLVLLRQRRRNLVAPATN
ncbi:PEP-CTERM sorting domain-containing protein [Actomonas aquatica]|uniref:PEP-CTERM sorting domain-containing protein n=1 Tax=Actomonas aquatica TaxID=2866162 RepID=A0ABZ1C2H9_9BACT|nr:PEP-CTERM sorting domain-containing protein [Opitutus sp. WL0086]WRQ85918.1 PEP-CTERM sorting domain-containing protein [Opitutus sp. WL0086]